MMRWNAFSAGSVFSVIAVLPVQAADKFATQMIDARKQVAEKLKAAVTEAGVADPVTDTLGANRMVAVGRPEMLTGGAFDREFASIQVKAHEEAESLEASLKRNKRGTKPELRSYLTREVPRPRIIVGGGASPWGAAVPLFRPSP